MALVMTLNMVSVGLNTLLLATLILLYGRILREVRTQFTMGLLVFAAVLLVQHLVQLYFFATMMSYYTAGVDALVLVQNVLVTLALLFLVYVTWAPVGGEAAPVAVGA